MRTRALGLLSVAVKGPGRRRAKTATGTPTMTTRSAQEETMQ